MAKKILKLSDSTAGISSPAVCRKQNPAEAENLTHIHPRTRAHGFPRRGIKTLSYFAVFDSAKEGGYNVSFPDFPGCVTFGVNFEEAKEKAKEVLELWLEE